MRLLVSSVLVLALAGCSADTGADSDSERGADSGAESAAAGDCTVRIEYAGTTYRADNRLTADAPRGEDLGAGQPVGCDDAPVSGYGTVEVSAITGVDPTIAVAVDGGVEGDLSGVYVAEGTEPSELPSSLLAG